MRILHLSTSLSGGAGGATQRLHQGLRQLGVKSEVLVRDKLADDRESWVAPESLPAKWKRRCFRLVKRHPESHPLSAYPNWEQDKPFSIQAQPDTIIRRAKTLKPDMVNLHWVCGGWMRIETLARLNCPIVWTMHDMWPFTGGCHHSEDCDGYQRSCGRCPRLQSDREHDLSNLIWKRKANAWKNLNLTLVAPSHWLADCARNSSLLGHCRNEVIPNGIDLETFSPIDKSAACEKLNLPHNKKIVLFVAWMTNHSWKGLDLLQDALMRLTPEVRDQMELVIVGKDVPNLREDFSLSHRYLGLLQDLHTQAMVYSAADVYVAPSRRDNLPTTVIEALACGTPSVAFRVGGLSDIIDHQENGYLAHPEDTDDLARGIAWILADDDRYERLSKAACDKARNKFACRHVVRQYNDLYKEVLSASG